MITETKNQTSIKICMACNENYAMHCASAIASMLDNHKSDEWLDFFILNSEISEKSRLRLEKLGNTQKSSLKLVSVNPQDFQNCPIPENMHFTLETYFRLKLPDFFPDFDKILYIDCDVTVLGDVKELWNFDVDGVFAGVCADISPVVHLSEFLNGAQNFNAGVMVINLKKMRQENISLKFFDFIEKYGEKIIWVDQDVLNSVLIPNVRYFERCWNLEYTPNFDVVSGLYPEKEIKLIHYITKNKPWNTPYVHIYANKYFKYLQKTPWRYYSCRFKVLNFYKRLKRVVWLSFQNFVCKKRIEKAVENRRAVLWGASLFITKIIEKYGLKTENILGIIDINPEKSGKKIGKYEIFSPKELKKLKPDLIISTVIARPKMKENINNELEKLGINIEIDAKLFCKIEEY